MCDFPLPLGTLASSAPYTLWTESPVGPPGDVGNGATLASVPDNSSAGIEPAAVKGGEIAAAETFAPVWPIAAGDAATLIEPCEPACLLPVHLWSPPGPFAILKNATKSSFSRWPVSP